MSALKNASNAANPSSAVTKELEKAFHAFVEAQELKNASIASEQLKKMLRCLYALKYTKKDITFALDVEPLTVARWEDGNSKGMKPDTYAGFMEFITDVFKGKSRRTVDISDTGFVTWRYLMQEQAAARRIWYITSSKFLVDRSLAFREAVKNLFLKSEGREPTRLVYLFPKGSGTESSLNEWCETLLRMESQGTELRGSIIGIADDGADAPGIYLPGLRVCMLEKAGYTDPVQVKGYIRVKLEEDTKKKLLMALDPLEEFQHTPWLTVEREIVERWYNYCDKRGFTADVERICATQTERFAIRRLPEEPADDTPL
ncbi:MAG: hypothetical protein JO250_10535 [Armatimonadetes bacterium]|nr:hypothetical protein [Armatimonadota bacterium]